MSSIDLGPVIIDLAAVPSPSGAGKKTFFRSSTYLSVEEAMPNTSIGVRAPSKVPGNARLLDVNIMREPREMAILTYEDERGGPSLIVVMAPIRGTKETQFTVGDTIEPISVGNQPAALIELKADSKRRSPNQTTIVWVSGNTLCQAIATGLSRAELVEVAESM
jgi:hypothetical protein